MSWLCAEDENTEAQRTQSFPSRLSSVISVPLCFKSEKLQSAIQISTPRGAADGQQTWVFHRKEYWAAS